MCNCKLSDIICFPCLCFLCLVLFSFYVDAFSHVFGCPICLSCLWMCLVSMAVVLSPFVCPIFSGLFVPNLFAVLNICDVFPVMYLDSFYWLYVLSPCLSHSPVLSTKLCPISSVCSDFSVWFNSSDLSTRSYSSVWFCALCSVYSVSR